MAASRQKTCVNERDSSGMINVAWRRDKEGGGILTTRASESEETR